MVFGDSVNFITVTVDSVDIEGTYEQDRQARLFSHTATITGTLPLMVGVHVFVCSSFKNGL